MPTVLDLINAQSKDEVISLVEKSTIESGIELTPKVREKCREQADKIEELVKAYFGVK